MCHPFYKVAHNWSARRYNIPIGILAILYNIVKIRELQTKEVDIEGRTVTIITPSDIRYNTDNTQISGTIQLTKITGIIQITQIIDIIQIIQILCIIQIIQISGII